MPKCPKCQHALPKAEPERPLKACPACGSALVMSGSKAVAAELDTEEMKPFGLAAPELYDRIRNVVPQSSWHLAVIAEIFDFEYKRLSRALNKADVIGNCIFNLKTGKSRIETLKQQFDEFVGCLADFQGALVSHLDPAKRFPEMAGLWECYQELNQAVDRLIAFHRSVSSLKFIRDSVEHTVQGQMTDWVHYTLICFEGLTKQLNLKSKLEPEQLRVRSVQVTLAPPDLHLFFSRLDKLEHPDA